MPVLPDEMYCSEQISIPPSFPYLLRQYAKAAIRTQPIDILKWSTAYFRCLSLNIPPPVKPRLEYPIPRDFHGITPGWLKALLYQLQNNATISFKVLWDRWIGACLEHNTLIKLLCIGGFDDPEAIPWLRFVAVCAGTLTDDLTHTMMLICEILTEEPEGGSAMVPLETFVDLYKFLARIDASRDQVLKNFWFRDSLLSLWREKVEKVEELEEVHEEDIAESVHSEATKSSSESVEGVDQQDDMEKVVSCPSLPEDDHYSLDYLMKEEAEPEEEVEGEGAEDVRAVDNEEAGEEEEGGQPMESDGAKEEKIIEEAEDAGVVTEENIEVSTEIDDNAVEEELLGKTDVVAEADGEEDSKVTASKVVEDANTEEEKDIDKFGSVESVDDTRVRDLNRVFEEDDVMLEEDLERLRALQQEMQGETDEELEKFKCRLIQEMPLTLSQEEGIKHFETRKSDFESGDKAISRDKIRSGEASSESQDGEPEKRPYDEVFCEAIPGIGAIVSDELVEAVEKYMKACGKVQHGVVMPRNIRHYSCPPLEALNY